MGKQRQYNIHQPNLITQHSGYNSWAQGKGPCGIETNGTVYFSPSNPDKSNGPTLIHPAGYISFRNNRNELHRTTGPSIIWGNGTKEYWICGTQIPADTFFLKYGVL